MMWNRARRGGGLDVAVLVVLSITVTWAAGSPSHAEEGKWTLRLEPIFMEAHGHDQHVLTVREIDIDSTPRVENNTAVSLDTDSGVAYSGGFRYAGKQWNWGADFFWFSTSQDAQSRTGAADGPAGTIDEVVFEIADQSFTSSDPSDALFYRVLEDTDLAVWTVDFCGTRALIDKAESDVRLQLGLRFGDFDNDYRAVVGVEGVGGTRMDASSNYDRMMGPLVGLAGDVHRGKSHITGYIGQSLLLGSAELSRTSREFTGPFGDAPSFFNQEVFRKSEDVAIPVTEFRIKWTYSVSEMVSLGVGANSSAWWDVPVPPGVIPNEGGETLHENTIVFFGLLGSVELRF